jgi:hypothetical protein
LYIKCGFNDTFVLSVGNSFAIRPSSQHQSESTEDNTFSGTGLTCQHRKTLLEIDIEAAYQRIVLYM